MDKQEAAVPPKPVAASNEAQRAEAAMRAAQTQGKREMAEYLRVRRRDGK
jgi:hypothetical protein